MKTYTLSTTAMGRLVGHAYRPSDEDWGPIGPGGPVIRSWDRVFLNPQPLPPTERATLERGGPHPEPWRVAALSRTVISRAIDSFEAAGIIIVGGDVEATTREITQSIEQYVDDLCPERPKRPKPFPWPWAWLVDLTKIEPVSVLAAGAEFAAVADALGEHPLQPAFAEAADRLFESGLARLEGTER